MESREHAEARGAKPYAKLTKVVADLAKRKQAGAGDEVAAGDVAAARRQRRQRDADHGCHRRRARDHRGARIPGPASRPCGARHRNDLRAYAWRPSSRSGLRWRHLSISRGALYPANDPTGLEVEKTEAPTQIVVVGVGHWQGEGMALVEAVS